MVDDMDIRACQPADENEVVALWARCGLVKPQNNPRADIQRKLADSPELFLVGIVGGKVAATVMAGYEGHRGWINYLAVAPDLQKTGLGREIMQVAEKLLRQRGCPKINLQVRATNQQVLAFYQSLGFAVDDVVSLGKRLVMDEPFSQ